jgi:hypothetical protein
MKEEESMKSSNLLIGIGTLLCTSLLGSELAITPTLAQSSSNAFVVFVNGSGDCCAGEMLDVKDRLQRQGATIWTTSYAKFEDGSQTSKVPVVNLSTDMDNAFIAEAAKVLNSLPESRPIILIGHSYGGDSILKILPSIKRRIQLVVTIDPVGTGGFREIAVRRGKIPPNVDYFMNRWQENGLADSNIVPFDSRINGSIPCSAGVCDQDSQNLARNADGSETRVSCRPQEVTCEGWRLPGCNFRGCWPGSNGTKARRIFHNNMPEDKFIQRVVGDKIEERLVTFSPPSQPHMGYFADGGTTFYADGQKFCGFLSEGHYQMHRFGKDHIPGLGNRSRGEFGSDGGACSIPPGYFAYENVTHYSLGNGQYCSFFTGESYERHGSQRLQESRFGVLSTDPKGFMTWAGGCS